MSELRDKLEVCFEKQGAEDFVDNMQQVGMQRYAPMMAKRRFSDDELLGMLKEKKKIMPKIFRSRKDKATSMMSSPGWAAAGSAIPGAAMGAGLGGIIGAGTGDKENTGRNAGIGALLGTLLGGGATGYIGYRGRQAKNDDIEEILRRLPEDATIRDYESDPAIQAERDRQASLEAAEIGAEGARGDKPKRRMFSNRFGPYRRAGI